MGFENLSPSEKKRKAVRELLEGNQLARQLQSLLVTQNLHAIESSRTTAQQLVDKISISLSVSLSVLRTCDENTPPVSPSKFRNSWAESRCSSARRCEDSGESNKRSSASSDRRGRYKRRKKADSWIEVSTTGKDGHTWRKYGQKKILNAKFPRSYYRCTHKHSQGCEAVKQVQPLDDESSTVKITYIGTHTCFSSGGPRINDLPQRPNLTRNSSQNFVSPEMETGSDYVDECLNFEIKQEVCSKDEASADETAGFATDTSCSDSLWNEIGSLQPLDPKLPPSWEALALAFDVDNVGSSASDWFGDIYKLKTL